MGLQEITEDRLEALKSAMVSIMKVHMCDSIRKMDQYFDENMDAVIDDLQKSITELYCRVARAQETKLMGKMRFINAFFMKSEVAEGNLQVKLSAYDEEGITKPTDISVIWYPEFISKYYKSDMEYLQNNLDKVLFRPTNRERMIARMLYAEDYYKIVFNFLILCREAFEYVEGIDMIEICDEVSVSGGFYQEQGIGFYQFQECEVWANL